MLDGYPGLDWLYSLQKFAVPPSSCTSNWQWVYGYSAIEPSYQTIELSYNTIPALLLSFCSDPDTMGETTSITDVIVKEAGSPDSKEVPACRDSVHDLCDTKLAGVLDLSGKPRALQDARLSTNTPARPIASHGQLVRCSSPYDYEKISKGKPSSLRSLAKLLSRITQYSGGDLEPLGVVGKGSYSVVYKCYLMRPGGVTEAVAVKRPRSKTVNNLDNMTFLVEEGVLMQLITHRRVQISRSRTCSLARRLTPGLSGIPSGTVG